MRKRLIQLCFGHYGSRIQNMACKVRDAAIKTGIQLRRAQQILQEYRQNNFKLKDPRTYKCRGRKSQLASFKNIILRNLKEWQNKSLKQ